MDDSFFKVYENQVAGHFGTLFHFDKNSILKQCNNEQELAFYREAQKDIHTSLREFIPSFFGIKKFQNVNVLFDLSF